MQYGSSQTVTTSFARATGAAAYSGGTVVAPANSGIITFPKIRSVVSGGAAGYITKLQMMSQSSFGTGDFNLWLFATTVVPEAVADGSAFSPTFAQLNTQDFIGYVNLPGANTVNNGTNYLNQNTDVRLLFRAAQPATSVVGNNNTALYAVLQTVGGFTPVSAQVIGFNIGFELN